MKHKTWINLIVLFGLLISLGMLNLTALPTAHAETTAKILYVKPEGREYGDCNRWDKSCSLQYALTNASHGTEIWVASGIYKNSGDRESFIPLKNGVAIYGGFDGKETSRDQRNPDPATNGTVLSGDLGTPVDDSENSFHVVKASGTDSSAVLDGFTITGGNADCKLSCYGYDPNIDSGGGMYIDASFPTLSNLIISGNRASNNGGGMYNNLSSPTLHNVTFIDNKAGMSGGGMYNTLSYGNLSTSHLDKVTFINNTAGKSGGGMYNAYHSNPYLVNVTFSGNTADGEGAGMYNESSNPSLVDVIFSCNGAFEGGGLYNDSSSPILTNVTFSDNVAIELGGGMHNANYSEPSLYNSIVWGKSGCCSCRMTSKVSDSLDNANLWDKSESSEDLQIYNDGTSKLIYCEVLIEGECPGCIKDPDPPEDEECEPFISFDPQFVDPANGNLRLQDTSPAIDKGHEGFLPPDTENWDGDADITEPIPYDIEGLGRLVLHGDETHIVDLGACEHQRHVYLPMAEK
jgi:hypothetical protein